MAPATSLRPKLRPKNLGRTVPIAPIVTPVVTPSAQVPDPKPNSTTYSNNDAPVEVGRDAATNPVPKNDESANSVRQKEVGKICKDRKLQGTEIGSVPGTLSGCGIRKGAIKLYSVAGVSLSRPAVMECDTARALKKWVEGGMAKSVKRYGGGVVELQVAAGYSCRTRNSRPGAKISEHGKGRAIDISGFELKSGDTISVLNDWGKGKKGRILKKMHKRACGPFGTVLGPNADRYHKDHFHFDVAKHRGGPYCR